MIWIIAAPFVCVATYYLMRINTKLACLVIFVPVFIHNLLMLKDFANIVYNIKDNTVFWLMFARIICTAFDYTLLETQPCTITVRKASDFLILCNSFYDVPYMSRQWIGIILSILLIVTKEWVISDKLHRKFMDTVWNQFIAEFMAFISETPEVMEKLGSEFMTSIFNRKIRQDVCDKFKNFVDEWSKSKSDLADYKHQLDRLHKFIRVLSSITDNLLPNRVLTYLVLSMKLFTATIVYIYMIVKESNYINHLIMFIIVELIIGYIMFFEAECDIIYETVYDKKLVTSIVKFQQGIAIVDSTITITRNGLHVVVTVVTAGNTVLEVCTTVASYGKNITDNVKYVYEITSNAMISSTYNIATGVKIRGDKTVTWVKENPYKAGAIVGGVFAAIGAAVFLLGGITGRGSINDNNRRQVK
jgi:hypothetical protein